MRIDDDGAAEDPAGPAMGFEGPRPAASGPAGLSITKDTRISDILREYGDIADVMEELGIRRVARYSFRSFLAKAITVERAARIHRVPVDHLIASLRAAVERAGGPDATTD